jgi:hypothetical protein
MGTIKASIWELVVQAAAVTSIVAFIALAISVGLIRLRESRRERHLAPLDRSS